ncbi:MAG: hybrid sensor histidine kinase/response regulator [Verrucomicrobia bacterium]|nr:hybrid sensor histidine kinase/response regulator [Verrucomicrobiota bacterium]
MSKNLDTVELPRPEDSVILVVDDVPNNIQVVGSILRGSGYQVVPATSGEQALRFSKNPAPDLVLLDLMMPEMDGFEVCRRLKSDPETSAIPIIFLTAAVETERVVKGLEMGAVDYVTKPFNPPELLARVRTHLELKHSREILERTAERLRELNSEKSEFLGIAAHDLKNPICSFIGLAEYVLNKPDLDRAELTDLAKDILTESRRLLQLVQNLLDVNAIERGQLKLQLAPCDLVEIAQTVIKSFLARADAKQQTLALDPGGSPSRVLADRSLTIQILDNLVSNALKFSPAGKSIRVGLRQTENGILCEVQDEGPGLSVEDQKRLFGKFVRLSARPTGGENSTGLGLSIAKKLIEAMNGSVWCESEAGHGAKFVIRLPPAP